MSKLHERNWDFRPQFVRHSPYPRVRFYVACQEAVASEVIPKVVQLSFLVDPIDSFDVR